MNNTDIPKELERLLLDALDAKDEGAEVFDITKYKDATLSIRIRGKKWNGLVDKNVAKFILDAEKQIKDVLDDEGIDYEIPKNGIIRLEVKNGSTELIQQIPEAIKILKTMTPEQIFLVTGAISVIIGAFKMPDIIRAVQARRIRQIEAEENVRLAEMQKEQLENVVDQMARLQTREYALEQPRRSLVNKMDDADSIDCGGKEGLTKSQVKKKFEKADRSKMENFYIDGTYIIEKLDTPESGDWKVKLKYGDVSFKADLKLDAVQLDKFVESYTTARKENKSVSSKLQVTATINNKGIGKAEVVGIGKKRESAQKLSKALAIAKRSGKKKKKQSGKKK